MAIVCVQTENNLKLQEHEHANHSRSKKVQRYFGTFGQVKIVRKNLSHFIVTDS
jgi:hypothetical protein